MAPINHPFPGMDDFRRYQSGEMSSEEQHKLEMLMLDDPFVAEAFDGFLASQQAHSAHSLVASELRGRLSARVEGREARRLAFWPYASAAAALICLGLYWVVFLDKVDAPPVETARQSAMPETPQVKSAEPAKPAPPPTSMAAVAKAPKLMPAQPAKNTTPDLSTKPDETVPLPSLDTDSERIATLETEIATLRSALPAAPRTVHAIRNDSGAPGFKPEKTLTGKQGLANFRRNEDSNRLSEVVVSHSSVAKKAQSVSTSAAVPFLPAQPADGWKAYQSYIEKNSLAEQEGKVTVSFVVGQDGSLSGFSAHGTQPLHQQAILLVRQGPAWNAARSNGIAISMLSQVEIHFRIRQ